MKVAQLAWKWTLEWQLRVTSNIKRVFYGRLLCKNELWFFFIAVCGHLFHVAAVVYATICHHTVSCPLLLVVSRHTSLAFGS